MKQSISMPEKIRVRFDDVLVKSDAFPSKEFDRFKYYMKLVRDSRCFYPSPNILVEDIKQFPECVSYLQENEEQFELDLHGYVHNPETPDGRNAYSSLSKDSVRYYIEESMVWWQTTFKGLPKRWVTPHGGDGEAMQEVAKEFNLILENTEYPVTDVRDAWGNVNRLKNATFLDHRVVMVHWWHRGLALERVILIYENGWDEAVKMKPEYFK